MEGNNPISDYAKELGVDISTEQGYKKVLRLAHINYYSHASYDDFEKSVTAKYGNPFAQISKKKEPTVSTPTAKPTLQESTASGQQPLLPINQPTEPNPLQPMMDRDRVQQNSVNRPFSFSSPKEQQLLTGNYATSKPSATDDNAAAMKRNEAARQKELAEQPTRDESRKKILSYYNSPFSQNLPENNPFVRSMMADGHATTTEEQTVIENNFSNVAPQYQKTVANYLGNLALDNPSKHRDIMRRVGGSAMSEMERGELLTRASAEEAKADALDLEKLVARKKEGKEVSADQANIVTQRYEESKQKLEDSIKAFPEYYDHVRKVKERSQELTIKDDDNIAIKGAKTAFATLSGFGDASRNSIVSAIKFGNDLMKQAVGRGEDYTKSDKYVEGIGNYFDAFIFPKATKYENEKDLTGKAKDGVQNFLFDVGGQLGNMAMTYATAAGSTGRLALSGAAFSYGGHYDEAIERGLDENSAQRYALFQSAVEGLLEKVSPNFGMSEFNKMGMKEGIAFLKAHPKATVKEYVEKVGKEALSENAQEILQNLGGLGGKVLTNNVIGEDKFDTNMTSYEIGHTVSLTTAVSLLASFVTGGRKAFGDLHQSSVDYLKGLKEGELLTELNRQKDAGVMTATQAENILDLVKAEPKAKQPTAKEPTQEAKPETAKQPIVTEIDESELVQEKPTEVAQPIQGEKSETQTSQTAADIDQTAKEPTVGQPQQQELGGQESESEEQLRDVSLSENDLDVKDTTTTGESKGESIKVEEPSTAVDGGDVATIEIKQKQRRPNAFVPKEVKEFAPQTVKEKILQYIAEGGRINRADFQAHYGKADDPKFGKKEIGNWAATWGGKDSENHPTIDKLFGDDADALNAFGEILQENSNRAKVQATVKAEVLKRKNADSGFDAKAEIKSYEHAQELETANNEQDTPKDLSEEEYQDYMNFGFKLDELEQKAQSDEALAKQHQELFDKVVNDPQYIKEDGSFDYEKLADNFDNEFGFEPNIIALELFESKNIDKDGIKTGKELAERVRKQQSADKSVRDVEKNQTSQNTEGGKSEPTKRKGVNETLLDAQIADAQKEVSSLEKKLADRASQRKKIKTKSAKSIAKENQQDVFGDNKPKAVLFDEPLSVGTKEQNVFIEFDRETQSLQTAYTKASKELERLQNSREAVQKSDAAQTELEIEPQSKKQKDEKTKSTTADIQGEDSAKFVDTEGGITGVLEESSVDIETVRESSTTPTEPVATTKPQTKSTDPIQLQQKRVDAAKEPAIKKILQRKLDSMIRERDALSKAAADKGSASMRRSNRAAVGLQQAVARFKKIFPNINIVTDPTTVANMQTKNGAKFRAFYSEGTVYLDTAQADGDAVVHEFGHLWVELVKNITPSYFKKAAQEIEKTPYFDIIKNDPQYPDPKKWHEEAMMLALEDADALLNEKSIAGSMRRAKLFVSQFLDQVKTKLFKLPPTLNITNMSIDDFLGKAIKDLNRQTPLTTASTADIYDLVNNKTPLTTTIDNSILTDLGEKSAIYQKLEEFAKLFSFQTKQYSGLGKNFVFNTVQGGQNKVEAARKDIELAHYRWIERLNQLKPTMDKNAFNDLVKQCGDVFEGSKPLSSLPTSIQEPVGRLVSARNKAEKDILSQFERGGTVVLNHDLGLLLTDNWKAKQQTDEDLKTIEADYDKRFNEAKALDEVVNAAQIEQDILTLKTANKQMFADLLQKQVEELQSRLAHREDKSKDLTAFEQDVLNEIEALKLEAERISVLGGTQNKVRSTPSATGTKIIYLKEVKEGLKYELKRPIGVVTDPTFDAILDDLSNARALLDLAKEMTGANNKRDLLKQIDANENLAKRLKHKELSMSDTIGIRYEKRGSGFDLKLRQRDGSTIDVKDVSAKDIENMLGEKAVNSMVVGEIGYLDTDKLLLNNAAYESIRSKQGSYTTRSYMKYDVEDFFKRIKHYIGEDVYNNSVAYIKSKLGDTDIKSIQVNVMNGNNYYVLTNKYGVESRNDIEIADTKAFLQSIDASDQDIKLFNEYLNKGDFSVPFNFNSPRGRYANHGIKFNATEGQILEAVKEIADVPDLQHIKATTTKGLDVSALRKKKDIDEAIRALMGEYTDPRVNIYKTTMKAATLAAKSEYNQNLYEAGMASGFFSETPNKVTGQTVVITAANLKTLGQLRDSKGNPMKQVYATQEVYDGLFGSDAVSFDSKVMQSLQAGSRFVKLNLTVLSQGSQTRNVTGGIAKLIENGNLGALRYWARATRIASQAIPENVMSKDRKASSLAKRGFASFINLPYSAFRLIENTIGKGKFGNVGDDTLLSAYQRMGELGLIDTNINMGSLRDYINEHGDLNGDKDSFYQVAGAMYQLPDSVAKIMQFLNEKDHLVKRGLSETDAEVRAAEIVRATQPTYGDAPRWARQLSATPFLGNFILYKAETFRTSYNTLAIAAQEMKEGDSRGFVRAASVSAMYAARYTALSYLSQFLSGADDEDDKAFRALQPDYGKNASYVYTKFDKNKKEIEYVDMSFTDPSGAITQMAQAVMQGKTSSEKFTNAVSSLADGFTDPDLFAKSVIESMTNTRDNKDIVNPQQEMWAYIGWSIEAQLDKFVPKIMTEYGRMGVAAFVSQKESVYKLTVPNEVAGQVFGVKIKGRDLQAQYDKKINELFNEYEKAKNLYEFSQFPKTSFGQLYLAAKYNTEEEKKAADKASAERQMQKVFAQMRDIHSAGKRFGLELNTRSNRATVFSQLEKGVLTNYNFRENRNK